MRITFLDKFVTNIFNRLKACSYIGVSKFPVLAADSSSSETLSSLAPPVELLAGTITVRTGAKSELNTTGDVRAL